MFFGGFSGATAFYPDRIQDSLFVPTTVLTDFQLSGVSVPIADDSPLKRSITYSNTIRLSHKQNAFSIEFSALSYFNTTTNRFRYKLDGLDSEWHEVGSEQRTASYTTLPKGDYIFRVQGATSRGAWSEPGIALHIEILPAFLGDVVVQDRLRNGDMPGFLGRLSLPAASGAGAIQHPTGRAVE